MALHDAQEPLSQGDGEDSRRAGGGLSPAAYPDYRGASGPGSYPPGYPGAQAAYLGVQPAPIHDLRPLTTGEILDRTFAIYRSKFWLFAGISSLAAAVQVVAAGAQMIGFHGLIMTPTLGAGRTSMTAVLMHSSVAILVGYAVGLIYFLATSVTQAGTAWALSEVYLGRSATVGEAMRLAGKRWGTFVAIALWQAFSLLWLPMSLAGLALGTALLIPALHLGAYMVAIPFMLLLCVFGGFAFGVIRYLMNSLAIPASAIEGSAVRPSMRRSKGLSRGTKGRICLVLLVVWAMYLVAGVIQAPMSFLFLRSPTQSHVVAEAIILLIGFLSHTLVAPVMMIGLTLVYFDQRVRTEAFDLVMLMSESNEGPGASRFETDTVAGGMGDAAVR